MISHSPNLDRSRDLVSSVVPRIGHHDLASPHTRISDSTLPIISPLPSQSFLSHPAVTLSTTTTASLPLLLSHSALNPYNKKRTSSYIVQLGHFVCVPPLTVRLILLTRSKSTNQQSLYKNRCIIVALERVMQLMPDGSVGEDRPGSRVVVSYAVRRSSHFDLNLIEDEANHSVYHGHSTQVPCKNSSNLFVMAPVGDSVTHGFDQFMAGTTNSHRRPR